MPYDPNDPFSDPNQDRYQPPPESQAPNQPSYADFQRDYWAPDRATVLAQMAPSPAAPTMAPQLPSYNPPNLTNVVNGSYSPNTGVASPNTGVTGGQAPLAPSPFNYERARDSWMSGQYGSGEAGARAWAAANGIQYNGGDTIALPNGGGYIDIIGNFQKGAGRNMTNNWTPAGGNGPNPGGQGTGGGPLGSALGVGGLGMGTGAASYGITSDALQRQYRDTLLRMMQQGEQPIDENSLGIKQPYEAARLASERQLEQVRQANAERLYGQGQLGGNELAQMNQQGRERAAVGLAGVKSGLVQGEIGARRQQLQQALQLANAVGARQEAMQLQRELAQLENQYRYSALGQQRDIWNDQYGLQRAAMMQAMNQNAFNAGYGNNEGG